MMNKSFAKRNIMSLMKYVMPSKYHRELGKLRLLVKNRSELRRLQDIKHFKDIHQIVPVKTWSEKRNMEHLMLMTYYAALGEKSQRNELRSREIKLYCQNGEDGLLLYIFSKIGVTNRKYVNIGCGGSSNTANLVINFGWGGLELDGSAENVQQTIRFYVDKIGSEPRGLSIKQGWLTRDNVNRVIAENGATGEIDLISIDIDGNDYWIWEAIDVVNPRVVLIEYNASFGAERSLSVKYDPNFERWEKHPSGWYHGASLAALTKLGKRKGYALIGCEFNGVNAFFVRYDLIQGSFVEVPPSEAFYSHFQRSKRMTDDEQFNTIRELDYVEI